MIIPIQSNCQSDSIFNNNQTLIIFNKLCQTTLFYSISISNLSFLNLTKYDLLDDFSSHDIPQSVLISMLFCSSEEISINFHNIFVLYILSEKKMYIQNRFESYAKIVQRLSNCENIQDYIEENITSKQLLINQKKINMSSQLYIQSYLVKQLLILHYKEELVAMFNTKVKQHIIYPFSNVLTLTELPLIFAISQKTLIIYRVYYPQPYFQIQKDGKYVKKIKINSGSVLPSSRLEFKKFEIFTEQNLKFFLQSSKITYIVEKLNDKICINHNKLQKSNPFEILIVQQKSQIIINQQNSVLNLCSINLTSQQKMFVIQEQDVQNYIILKIQHDILLIYACEQNQLKRSHKIKIEKHYINIFSFPNVLRIVIIYHYKIIVIELKNQQIIQQIQNLDLQILNCVQISDDIFIIFEDCRKAIMNINSEKIQVLFKQTYPFDCRVSLQFIFNEVFITQNEIIISSKKNFKRKLLNLESNKNIMTIVLYQYLIIVRQVQNEYQLKLFYIHEEQAIFLYNLPTYDFKITHSLEYQTYESYLMLKAFKQNINYLLIYDISKTAILSLIRITKIDKDETFFFILSSNQILYYFEGQFIIQNIISTCFNYCNNFVNEKFLFQEEFKLKVISQINNQILNVTFELITLSDDYNLRLLNQEQILISNNTINLSNIYGSIENIEIFPQEEYQIIYPLTFTHKEQKFLKYQSAVCYKIPQRININCFDDNQFQIHENSIQNILHVANQKNKTFYQVYYELNTHEINLMLINIELDQYQIKIEKIQIPDDLYKDRLSHNIHIIKTTQNLSIFQLLNGKNYITFNNIYHTELSSIFKVNRNLVSSYLFDSNFVFISESSQHINIMFIAITQVNEKEINYDIRLDCKQILNTIIPEGVISILWNLQMSLKIFQIQIEKDLIHFEIGIFFHQYFALLMSFKIDKKFESMPELQSTTILRYQKEFQFVRLLYVDNNFTILILSNNEIHEFVYVYDIRRRKVQQNIDSIQKLINQQYTAIERYNQSHYILISKDRIIFITLDEPRFSCQTLCQAIQSIQFSNEVSKIQIEISDFQQNKVHRAQVSIILVTFICILLIQKFLRKNNLQAKLSSNLQSQLK
ncbi:unnamed protein product [Paramecium primaurelia]|uniref:Transmembrane protein n=1 Tax=Paramecium primaurelia TaxID=5886 RepID=A0A8S1PQ90_PARPR|nr:unnamed protein product [Paramecium primaurelia]